MRWYVNEVYKLIKGFPREELYGSVSQWRRASLSITLNYIEGYARRKLLVRLNFLEISFGSFKEAQFIQEFAKEQGFISPDDHCRIATVSEEIGAMLWTEIKNIDKSLEQTKS